MRMRTISQIIHISEYTYAEYACAEYTPKAITLMRNTVCTEGRLAYTQYKLNELPRILGIN